MLVDQLPTLSSAKVSDEVPIERGTNLFKIQLNGILLAVVSIEDEMLVIGEAV